MGHAPEMLSMYGLIGQLTDPLENGNTNPRFRENTSGLFASHRNRHTAFSISHVAGMHSSEREFHSKTDPTADDVSHTMLDDVPSHTPPETEKAMSTSGSDAACAIHCVKLNSSPAAQNSAEAVEQFVSVV
jgi:hypothetical protein